MCVKVQAGTWASDKTSIAPIKQLKCSPPRLSQVSLNNRGVPHMIHPRQASYQTDNCPSQTITCRCEASPLFLEWLLPDAPSLSQSWIFPPLVPAPKAAGFLDALPLIPLTFHTIGTPSPARVVAQTKIELPDNVREPNRN